MLTEAQQVSWETRGFFIVPQFAAHEVCPAMLARAIEIARLASAGNPPGRALVTAEAKPNPDARNPEDRVSKIFRLHRDGVFNEFCTSPRVLDLIEVVLGADIDCFLSQFIFKNRGAMGQPWHQDSFYFPFSKAPQLGL